MKVAPLNEQTLPTLELLSAYLSIKCLETLVSGSNFKCVDVKYVTILLDNECALAWLLSEQANRKNNFVNNRLKEISAVRASFSEINITMASIADAMTSVPRSYLQSSDGGLQSLAGGLQSLAGGLQSLAGGLQSLAGCLQPALR